jgi:hypothetical protein
MSDASTPFRSVSSAEPAGRVLWCCGCGQAVTVRLTDGSEIYPHRRDLYSLPFWKCDACKNFVGCHHKTKDRTKPLGCVPTPEIKRERQRIHRILDPVWKSRRMTRKQAYQAMAKALGRSEYHTAELSSIEECRDAYRAAQRLAARSDSEAHDD